MGLTSTDELTGSPLAGALWETMVFTEFQRLLSAGIGSWQLNFWRDRTKEADFLLHRAGTFALADAKWSTHPSELGRLERIWREFPTLPRAAVVCRTPNAYPLGEAALALPLADLRGFLEGNGVREAREQ